MRLNPGVVQAQQVDAAAVIPSMVAAGQAPRDASVVRGRGGALGAVVALGGGLAVFLSWPVTLLLLAPHRPGILVFRVCAALWGFFGVTQLVYVVPIYLWAARKGLGSFCDGLRIGAKVVFIVNMALIAFFYLWPFPLLK